MNFNLVQIYFPSVNHWMEMANLNMQLYRFLMNMNRLSDDKQFFSVNLNRSIMMLCRFFDEKITDADRKQEVNAHAYHCKRVRGC